MSTTFTTWVEWIAQNGTALAIVLGVFGALVAHTIAAGLRLNNGFRLVAATAGFGALFAAGQSALGQRTNASANAQASASESRRAEGPRGLRARARALIDRVPDDLSLSMARQEVISFAAGFTTPPLRQFAGVASDTTAHALAAYFADALQSLRTDSAACITFLFGVLNGNLPPELSTDLEGRYYKLAAQVAKEGRETPQIPIDEKTATAVALEMRFWLWRTYGDRGDEMLTLLSNPDNALSKPRQVCAAATAAYGMIADMPRSRGGKLMRYMLYRRPGEKNAGSVKQGVPIAEQLRANAK